jgi:hypothetical protein
MKLRHVASCGLVCAAIALAGCDQGRQAPAKVNVRVVNAAPNFAELAFQREQDSRNLLTLPFKGATEFSYDADTYDFFVLERGYDLTPGRNWTFAPTLAADKSYTFVFTEVATEVVAVVLERDAAPPADAAIEAVHAGGGLPAMDLYLERPGLGIGGATPRGTLSAGGQLSARALPSGDYELWLTAAGNPANVLFTTATINLPAANTTAIVVAPEGNLGTAQFSVVLVATTQAALYDRNATTAIRVLNVATDRAPRDFAIDNVFSPPLFSATAFADPTSYSQVPLVSNLPIAVTPVGNPGVLELNQTFSGFVGERATILFGGPTGALIHARVADDGRRFHNEAKLRFFNGASQFTAGLDFLIGNPGDNPADLLPAASLAPVLGAPYIQLGAGDYDLYLRTVSATPAIVAGPTRITVAKGGIYGMLAVDGPDTATAGMVLFDDFP